MTTKVIIRNILTFSLALMAGAPCAYADLLDDGRQAFMDYDFEKAAELYDKYAKSLKRNPDAYGERLLEKYRRQLEIAENSLDNVQKVEIIDRFDVPADKYIDVIKLPSVGGKILSPDRVPVKNVRNSSDFTFTNEDGDFAMWTEMDSVGTEHIMESHRLTDGSWEMPIASGNVLNDGGSVRNPFMLSDGLTVYFSSDGEGSMGGYDICVASKDPATGEFRQPVGVGYPFNSPLNEYLMAIDEANGIGWWVTDRNNLDGNLSVYVFRTNDVRRNYVADEEPDIVALARLSDITLAQNPETDYAAIMSEIDSRAQQAKKENSAEFYFPMPGGKIYRNMSDFSSAKAQRSFTQYLKAKEEHDAEINMLRGLRMKYHDSGKNSSSAKSLESRIKDLETQIEWQREKLKKMRNAVISAETKE